jgi:predicted dinucleotide-binding enzyme
MKIAIIGAGNVGRSLAAGWSRACHEVTFGVADPTKPGVPELSRALPNTTVSANCDAVADADAIVLAVPWDAVPVAVGECGDLGGKILIDATNPLRFGDAGLELALGFSDSGGETVARLAPGARVVKTMNQVGFAVMFATDGYPTAPVMFLAGDDEEAKTVARGLVTDLGFEVFDAGPLRQARLLEPLAMLWIDQALNRGAPATNALSFMQKAGGR